MTDSKVEENYFGGGVAGSGAYLDIEPALE